jgi:hypothetical protein
MPNKPKRLRTRALTHLPLQERVRLFHEELAAHILKLKKMSAAKRR